MLASGGGPKTPWPCHPPPRPCCSPATLGRVLLPPTPARPVLAHFVSSKAKAPQGHPVTAEQGRAPEPSLQLFQPCQDGGPLFPPPKPRLTRERLPNPDTINTTNRHSYWPRGQTWPGPERSLRPRASGGGAQWGPPPHFQTSKPSCRNRARASQAASGAGAGQVQGHVQLRSQPRSSPHWPAEVPSRGESPGGQRPPHQPPQSSPLAGGEAPEAP